MKKRIVMMAVLALLVGVSLFVFERGVRAHGDGPGIGHDEELGPGPGPDCAMGMGRHGHAMAKALDLSKEQMDKMAGLRSKFAADAKPLRDQLLQKRADVRKLYTDPKVDEATILTKQREMGPLQQQLLDRMVQFRLEQRRILTPEQLKKLNDFALNKAGHGRRGHCG